nr:MAG TPA: hypothetical protein [Caudoviricetes sp.]
MSIKRKADPGSSLPVRNIRSSRAFQLRIAPASPQFRARISLLKEGYS